MRGARDPVGIARVSSIAAASSAIASLICATVCARAEDAAAADPVVATLPRDLSPWGMFLSADIFVRAVMIGLAFASVVTWTVALAKGIELLFSSRRLSMQGRLLARAVTLADAAAALRGRGGFDASARAAMAEMDESANLDPGGIKERISARLERVELQSGRRMGRATGILATIGATAPFVGLFGTVWGVMNSFIGISKQHTTNLAVVAPGIAEALLATALGLVAAIPAVVFYNLLARAIAGHRARYADGSEVILRLASRDLDRANAAQADSVRSRPSAAE